MIEQFVELIKQLIESIVGAIQAFFEALGLDVE